MRICTRSWPWLTACCQSSSIRDSLLTQTKSRDNTSAQAERGEKSSAEYLPPRSGGRRGPDRAMGAPQIEHFRVPERRKLDQVADLGHLPAGRYLGRIE